MKTNNNNASIIFGSTDSDVAVSNGKTTVTGSDTKVDMNRIGTYHPDKTGVTTLVHELYHNNALRTGQDAAAGDKPTSSTGPAEQEGQRVAAQAPDLTKQQAQQELQRLITAGAVRIIP